MTRLGQWAQTFLFAVMLAAASGWVLWLSAPAAETHQGRAWIRDGDGCRYATLAEAAGQPACQQ